jgi:hypothetical protein
MIVVPASDDMAPEEPLASWLSQTIFVPGGEEMPDEAWELAIAILLEVGFAVPSRSCGEPVEASAVSVSS